MHSYTNRLINESSPYLLQHAHNPVDWHPWNDEAFEIAKKENKPLLVSIGYSACHWCHVMERESFEDPEVAAFMNENFINIKVDREERPDVDHVYMDAVQAMTGSGGWPLNVFITPEGKPFYGGTYYPPKRAFNRASWIEILQALAKAYNEKKDEIDVQAENLTQHLQSTNAVGTSDEGYVFDKKNLDASFESIMKTADRQWGGFGKAPKFPQTFTISFLLRYSWLTNNNNNAREQALLSLDKMIQGGIYDHLAGGFARYSTDTEWLAPHFEKMLYDNALLVHTLSEAYQLTNIERYKDIVEQTIRFIEEELMHEEGGFFSALDADSEGEEGRFYVWQYEEIKKVLGEDAHIFSLYYNVKEGGNWEGKNILHTPLTMEDFADKHRWEVEKLKEVLSRARTLLLAERNKRVRPSLDDKLLLSWNALMNSAFSKAYAATGNEHYKKLAIRNMNFLLSSFSTGQNFYHSWKNGKAKHLAFLDDYSFLIAGLVDLSEITADTQWLNKAKELTYFVLENFSDENSPLFYFTQVSQNDIFLRKKEVYDSAIPAGNSVMAINFYRLGILYDNSEWREKGSKMMASMGSLAVKYPTSFAVWLSGLLDLGYGTNEIAIVGPDYLSFLKKIISLYLPNNLVMASAQPNDFPLLKDKISNSQTLIYLCKDYACQKPVSSVEELIGNLSSNFFKENTIFK